MKLPQAALMIGLVGTLAACSGGEGRTLHQLRNNRGTPEEFAIVPNKPLVRPETYGSLPAPTPGGANRTDQTPRADVVAALGGNPAALASAAAPASDMALLSRATRYGADPAIRTQLATEDAAFRRRKSIFNWKLVPDNEYNRAYRDQSLDSQGALDAWRRTGVRTPSAPPAGE
ncbi:DUF3035 domain-containing protein [Salipiger marinus]|uniref:Beta-barrel assembly machine subunit BamF n=1 Tax=Salipiger marinus TaxID=555512 RepID=A0A1G8IT85_9RHOB|nr:DUF3035 domain-containing protein [Salipiger marinus]SDI22032.1 Beta-barrel assembly machine subunit BamF [Salipiger marinus]HBT02828.1 DUF3035 domain-containing protein [Citreicella sp.]